MAFWTHTGPGITEPKRKFRFKVEFMGLEPAAQGAGNTMWYAKSVTKPSFQISAAEHKYLNHTFYYPGSVTWQDVSMTLVDPGDPDMVTSLSSIIVAGGYSPPANANDMTSMSKSGVVAALGAVNVHQLDANGDQLESWTLRNAFITELKFGDLEYGADELIELSLTLKYDWATLTPIKNSPSIASAAPCTGVLFTP